MDTDRRFLSYVVAIASTVIALLLSFWLGDITTQMRGTFFFIAIAASASYGGRWPGIVTTILSVVAFGYFFISPVHQIHVSSLESISQLILFSAVAFVINLVSARLKTCQHSKTGQVAWDEVEKLQQQSDVKLHRLEQILQWMPVGVVIADAPSGTISFCNQEAVRLLQRSPGSDVEQGGAPQTAIHIGQPYQPEKFLIVHSLLSGEVVRAKELLYQQQDGTTVTLIVSATPIRDHGGQLVLTICTFEDVSDRKRAEESLHESQRFIQQIADASPNILYLYDAQQQCNIYCNREIANVLGYAPHEIQAMGSNLFQNLMHPDDLARVTAQQERLSNSKDNEILEFEYRMKDANGDWRWLYSRDAVFSRNTQGQVQQIVGTAQDITNIKQAEEIIRQQAEREILLREITQRIRQSLDLQTIFDTACQETLCWSQAERVGIFKFDSDSQFDNGEFVAEALAPGFTSVLATRVHDHCFGNDYAPLY